MKVRMSKVIDDALAKQKATGDRIITFEALAKKKGEKAPTIEEIKAREGKQLTTSSKGNSARTQEEEAPPATWTGYIPLLAGIALAFIGVVKLRGFMRLTSIGLGLVLTLFGFARVFPESSAAKQLSEKVDEIAETTGTKKDT